MTSSALSPLADAWTRSTTGVRVVKPSSAQAPATWREWLGELFPSAVDRPMGEHHVAFWDYVWAMRASDRPAPELDVWPREGGKSTNVELAVVAVGCRGARFYVLIVRKTQDSADTMVQNIADKLESAGITLHYPQHSRPLLGKTGSSRGWRRNRLRTAGGFTVEAVGLDVKSIRGLKVGDQRPDLVVFDDIDDEDDTPATTTKKKRRITTAILPAMSQTGAVLGVQNLIVPDGIFTTLVDGRADYLSDRHVNGPIPAVRKLTWEWVVDETTGVKRPRITGGVPTWVGQDLATCERQMGLWGPAAFMREAQHQVHDRVDGLALHFDPAEHFVDLTLPQIRELVRVGNVFAGIDFQAWRFAFLLFAADSNGVATRIGEIFSQREELSIRAFRVHRLCELLGVVKAERLLIGRCPIWGDSANPQDIMEINAAFKRLNSPLRVVGVGRDAKLRRPTIQRINDKLAERAVRFVRVLPRVSPEDDHWRLGYHAGSEGVPQRGSRLIWEMEHWSYPTPPDGNVDLKEDPSDHTADGADCIAAERYALGSWWRPAKPASDGEFDPWAPEVLAAEAQQTHVLRHRLRKSSSRRGRPPGLVEDI